MPSPLTLARLTPALLPEWLAFFDGPAFADNPEWGTCYCRCLLFGAHGRAAWDQACGTPGENRAAMCTAIAAGEVDGVLARRDHTTVGWLHFGPASRFVSPIGTRWGTDAHEGAVACFMVALDHRRTGVGRAMLRFACEALAAEGCRAVNAWATVPGDDAAMHQFTGPLSLYREEGFAPVGEPTPGAKRVFVSKPLR